MAAADNAMKSLGLALAALNRRSDDIAANASQARERAEAAEKAVTELRRERAGRCEKQLRPEFRPPNSTPCKSASPRSNNPPSPRARTSPRRRPPISRRGWP